MRKNRYLFLLMAGIFLFSASSVRAGLSDFVGKIIPGSFGSASGESRLSAGLREALKVSAEKAVQRTGRKDGYYANPAIRIPMPEKLKTMESLLRKAGFGPKLDEFILSMNRAAERAAPQAKAIFLKGLTQMTFDDAEKVFKGGDTAATDFFKRTTSEQLSEAYRPVIVKAMEEYGVTRQYQAVLARYQALPFAKKFPAPGAEDYVTSKAVEGLFIVLAEEEKNIRRDPAARATQLLKEVFGGSPA